MSLLRAIVLAGMIMLSALVTISPCLADTGPTSASLPAVSTQHRTSPVVIGPAETRQTAETDPTFPAGSYALVALSIAGVMVLFGVLLVRPQPVIRRPAATVTPHNADR